VPLAGVSVPLAGVSVPLAGVSVPLAGVSVPLAGVASRTYYQLGRLQSMTEWWHWLLLVAVCGAVVAYVAYMYRRDSVELSPGLAIVLFLLRGLAFVGLLFFFFDLEKRTERKLVKNSRAVLVVDTSQSMGLEDASSTAIPAGPTRIDQVVEALASHRLVPELRARHDVIVYRFDETDKPEQVAAFPKIAPRDDPRQVAAEARQAAAEAIAEARGLYIAALAIVVAAFVLGAWYLVSRARARPGDEPSWTLPAALVAVVAAVVVLAVASLRQPDVSWRAVAGLPEAPVSPSDESPAPIEGEGGDPSKTPPAPAAADTDWRERLAARGGETRLGEALRYLIERERGGPIAAITVFTDGRSNAGIDPSVAIEMAREANIPIMTVGLGSDQRPVNVRVVDLEAPQRVFPGDRFTMTGYLQAYGLAGRRIKVELVSAPAEGTRPMPAAPEGEAPGTTFEEERRVDLPEDGEMLALKFDVTPTEGGRRTYRLRVTGVEQDSDPRDNEIPATVEIVDRKNRVLLVAGGPTREYQFLRNQLFRDRETTVDVLLQSGQPGISQEASDILFDFPNDEDEVFAYDAIVAFDLDWRAFSASQLELLERWVAEKAGGLLLVAGPVHTPDWAAQRRGDPRIDLVKTLYPVVFYTQGSAALSLGRFGSDRPSPIRFTRDGEDAEFLWLTDERIDSQKTWASFEGVYGYFGVKDIKPGTTVYARLAESVSAAEEELPIYMASQYYGAGRVFFLASGEMWRLRSVDDNYFEQFYTKLLAARFGPRRTPGRQGPRHQGGHDRRAGSPQRLAAQTAHRSRSPGRSHSTRQHPRGTQSEEDPGRGPRRYVRGPVHRPAGRGLPHRTENPQIGRRRNPHPQRAGPRSRPGTRTSAEKPAAFGRNGVRHRRAILPGHCRRVGRAGAGVAGGNAEHVPPRPGNLPARHARQAVRPDPDDVAFGFHLRGAGPGMAHSPPEQVGVSGLAKGRWGIIATGRATWPAGRRMNESPAKVVEYA
jgi:hypothetical protein